MVEIIKKKIIYILNNISILEKEMAEISFSEYEKNILLKKATERILQEIAEAILDVSNHIIAENNFKRPISNKEIFDLLINESYIPEKYRETLYSLASFRNFIVHSYDKIDDNIVYNVVKKHLSSIKAFVKEFKT